MAVIANLLGFPGDQLSGDACKYSVVLRHKNQALLEKRIFGKPQARSEILMDRWSSNMTR